MAAEQFAPRMVASCFWLRVSPAPSQPAPPRRGGLLLLLLLLLLRQQLLGRRRSGAGSSSGRYGSAMAPCSLPARAIPCACGGVPRLSELRVRGAPLLLWPSRPPR